MARASGYAPSAGHRHRPDRERRRGIHAVAPANAGAPALADHIEARGHEPVILGRDLRTLRTVPWQSKACFIKACLIASPTIRTLDDATTQFCDSLKASRSSIGQESAAQL
jgi:hypothetical protein